MDMHSKNELTTAVAPRYLQASKQEKHFILDEYCVNAGLNRKYAIRKLKRDFLDPPNERRFRKRNRPSTYGEVHTPLVALWETADSPCGWRLKELLPHLIQKAISYDELPLSEEQIALLLSISSSTIDRMLKGQWRMKRKKTNSQTRKGSPYSMIPFAVDLEEVCTVGILEIDLVAHCGGSAVGTFVNTLSTTEFISGWQESEAIMGKHKEAVRAGLVEIQKRLPIPLKGIDFDSGSEFVNDVIWQFCQEMKLTISKSRPYTKNDNAHIEQKNWTNVRRVIGYLRFETEEERELLNDLYRHELRLYINFFLPSGKLISKQRVGSKVKRIYDKPKTPYHRILERNDVDPANKRKLRAIYDELNPFELKRRIDDKLAKLVSLIQRKGAA
jgi:hypothetical protein